MARKTAPKNAPESPETAVAAAAKGDAKPAGGTAPAGETAGGEQTPPQVAKPKDAAKALQTVKTVVVKGPRQGRWRCGRFFGTEPVSIPLEELDESEFKALEADPALIVTTVDAPY